jgi:hypothetical protein
MSRTWSAFLFALVLLVGTAQGASAQAARPKRDPNLISQTELEEPAIRGRTILDAIQRLRPNWMRSRGATDMGSLGGTGTQPKGASCGNVAGASRGSCSAVGENQSQNVPGLIVNDVRQDFEMMRRIRAVEVQSAAYLNAADATTRYGSGYPNGVVIITTIAISR